MPPTTDAHARDEAVAAGERASWAAGEVAGEEGRASDAAGEEEAVAGASRVCDGDGPRFQPPPCGQEPPLPRRRLRPLQEPRLVS